MEVHITLHHRIPNIQTVWSTLGKAKYLSVLDLTSAFFLENLHPTDGSREKTAFTTEYGHFEWVSVPQGAKNSPAFFQKRVESVLRKKGLLNVGMIRLQEDGTVMCTPGRACVTPYVDDLCIYSNTLEDHMSDLRKVLECLSENQLYQPH